MIPKIIHLCWFSEDPFPVEIKICLDSWKRHLPEYEIKRWTYEDADAIGVHRIYGSWRKRKFGRKVEIWVKHIWHLVKYALFHK